MKKFIILFILSVVLVGLSASEIYQTVTFSAPVIEAEDGYELVMLKDCRAIGHPGEPLLPRFPVSLLLPPGQIAEKVEIIDSRINKLSNSCTVKPVQQEYPIGYTEDIAFTQPDPRIYNSDNVFPAQIWDGLQTHFSRGHGIAYFNICPFEYFPKTGEIFYLESITYKVTTVPDPLAERSFNRFYKDDEKTITRIKNIVSNPEKISTYPELDFRTREEDYNLLIITNSLLEEHLTPLIELKNTTGYQTQVILVEDIENEYDGQDLQEQIRNCIIEQYENFGIEYVLLAGDDEIIPHRAFFDSGGGSMYETDIPADIYYSNLDGTWNDDEDNLWAEPGEDDLLGEVFIGRMACDSEEEITNFVNKTIMYQTEPCVEDIDEALMVGENLGWTPWGMHFKEEIRYGSDNFGYTTAGLPEYFNVETLYDYNFTWSPYNDLLPALNAGPNLVNHMGHCSTTYAMKLDNPDITENNVTNDGVENGFNILYSQGCYCGAFDNRDTNGSYLEDCIAEVWTGLPTGTAAMVMNSRYGWGNLYDTDGSSQYLDRQFFDAIFGEGITKIGETQLDSKEDNIPYIDYRQNRWCYYCSNLFGDPTLDIWTGEPETLAANHNGAFIVGQQEYLVTVTNTTGYPIENAKVALSVGGECVGKGYTNVQGIVNIHLFTEVLTPGEMLLSVSGHDLHPLFETIAVIPPEGPYVILQDFTILAGDDDYLEAGETCYIDIQLTNIGVESSEELEIILSTEDPYLTFQDNSEIYSILAAGGSTQLTEAFCFEISASAPDHHPAQITGIINSGSDSWNIFLNMMIYEPNVFAVDPGFFELEMGYQDIDTELFTISNTSDHVVEYTIRTQEPAGRDVTGSHITCNTDNFTPGETVDWLFTVYNQSPDNEWITDVVIEFPAGITVNEATDFVGGTGGPLVCDGSAGEAAVINWHGETAMGYGVLHQNQAAIASVNVTTTTEIAGNINISYSISGDEYGDDPHTVTGSLQLDYPLSWISLNSSSGSLNVGENDQITITFDANELGLGIHYCEILINDGDRDYKKIPVSLLVTNTDADDNLIVGKPQLLGNYPNPFNPTTTISFDLTTELTESTELSIYNLKGQKVKTFDRHTEFIEVSVGQNHYNAIWNGTDETGKPVPSGIYFYKLNSGDYSSTRKMLLLK